MSTVLYSATVSADGYLAGPGGDMSWLRPHLGANPEVDLLQERIRALLVGATTFRGDDPNRGTDAEGAFGGTWSGPSFVVTHHPPADPVPDTTFVPDVRSGLAAARAAAGDDVVNVLGADVARQCLELGQLDEVLLIVAPVLLGDGTRFLSSPGMQRARLQRDRVDVLPHATNIWFRVVRG